jgi:uncharacterized protein with HEPN domain
MIDAGETIVRYVKRGKAAFLDDAMMRDAVEHQFLRLGRAAGRLSQPLRDAHPAIPWRTIIAFGETLVPSERSLDPEKVWNIIGGPLRTTLEELRKLTK